THSVLLDKTSKVGALVATDGHRLHCVKLDAPVESPTLLPQKLLSAFMSIPSEGEVSIRRGGSHIIIKTDTATLTNVPPEGTFPPYKDIIPKSGTGKVEVESAALVNALKRAAVLTSEETKGVCLGLGKKTIALS